MKISREAVRKSIPFHFLLFLPQVRLVLEDTGGQEGYEQLCSLTVRSSDIILMCFSIDSPDTLENVQEKWNPHVRRNCPDVPVILVGNKRDLRNDPATRHKLERMKQSPVSQDEGKAKADEIGASAYVECSAKDNEGVLEVFETAIIRSLKKNKNCLIM